MMFNQKSFKQILVILCIIAAAFFVAYYFLYEDVKGKNEHISSLVQDLDFQSSRQEYLISTQRMIQNINSDIDRINNSIVATDGDVKFIEGLEAIARSEGLSVTIDSLGIEDSVALDASGVTNLKLRAKTKGPWSGTYAFISQLESLPYKIKINSFGIQSDGGETTADGKKLSVPQWQSSFEIQVLKYK